MRYKNDKDLPEVSRLFKEKRIFEFLNKICNLVPEICGFGNLFYEQINSEIYVLVYKVIGESIGKMKKQKITEISEEISYQLVVFVHILQENGIVNNSLDLEKIYWDNVGKKICVTDFSNSLENIEFPEFINCEIFLKAYNEILLINSPDISQQKYFPAEFSEQFQQDLNKIIPAKIDIYSVGMIIYELKMLDFGKEAKAIFSSIQFENFKKHNIKTVLLDYNWRNLITNCIEFEPKNRINSKELLNQYKKLYNSFEISENLKKLFNYLLKKNENAKINFDENKFSNEFFNNFNENSNDYKSYVKTLFLQGKLPKCIEFLRDFNENFSNYFGRYKENWEDLINLAYANLFMKIGNISQSEYHFNKVKNQNYDYKISICKLCFLEGNLSKIESILKNLPENAEKNLLLGEYYEKMCDYNQAINLYKNGLFMTYEKFGSNNLNIIDFYEKLLRINLKTEENCNKFIQNYHGLLYAIFIQYSNTKSIRMNIISGIYFYYIGKYVDAINCLKIAENEIIQNEELDMLNLVEIYEYFSKIYIEQGNLENCTKICNKIKEILVKINDFDYQNIAEIYISLINLNIFIGNYEDSEKYCNEIEKIIPEIQNIEILIEYFQSLVKFEEILQSFDKSILFYNSLKMNFPIKYYDKNNELQNSDILEELPPLMKAKIYNLMCLIYLSFGNRKKADVFIDSINSIIKKNPNFEEKIKKSNEFILIKNIYFQQIDIIKKCIENYILDIKDAEKYENKILLINLLIRYSKVLLENKGFIESLNCLKKALEIVDKHFLNEHYIKSRVLYEMGENFQKQNYISYSLEHYKKAKIYAKGVLKIPILLGMAKILQNENCAKCLDKIEKIAQKENFNSPYVAQAYNLKALKFLKNRDYENASNYFDKSLKSYGEDNISKYSVYLNMAKSYIKQFRFKPVENCIKSAENLLEKMKSKSIPKFLECVLCRIYFCRRKNNYAELLKIDNFVTEKYTKTNSDEFILIRLKLAKGYKESKNFEKANKNIEISISICKDLYNESNFILDKILAAQKSIKLAEQKHKI